MPEVAHMFLHSQISTCKKYNHKNTVENSELSCLKIMLLLLRKQLCIVMLVCFQSGMVTITSFAWSPAEVCRTFKCLISLGEELAVDSGSIHLLLWSHEIFLLHVGMSTAVIN